MAEPTPKLDADYLPDFVKDAILSFANDLVAEERGKVKALQEHVDHVKALCAKIGHVQPPRPQSMVGMTPTWFRCQMCREAVTLEKLDG